MNGVLVGTSTAAFGVNDQSVLRIGGGASEGAGNYFFEGDVDEAAIYNKALSPERIILHSLGGTAASAPLSLGFTREPGRIILSWSAGSLESAPAVSGPWTPVNALSPHPVVPDQDSRFFRLRGGP